MKISPLVAIFLTVFFDMMSFGTIIPDIQIRAPFLGAKGVVAGLVLSIFSITQFIVSPFLGRWSDRVGRRKVLMLTCAFATVSSLVYCVANNLTILFLSRALMGVAGANLGVAYAYVSDITTPEQRPAAMGKIGMAFGFGFMIGPPLGAFMLKIGHNDPFLLGLVSAIFAFINFIFVSFFMPDALPTAAEPEELRKLSPMQKLVSAMKIPGLGFLLILFFVANLAFSNLESTYFRLAHDVYKIDQLATSTILVYVGIIAAVVQGALIGPLVKRFSEINLLRVAYVLQSPVLASIPFVQPWIPVLAGCTILGLGNGLAQPTLSSLVSKAAPAAIAGGIFGVMQSLGAIARIVGPLISNPLYEIDPKWPYFLAAAMMLIPIVMSQRIRKMIEPTTA